MGLGPVNAPPVTSVVGQGPEIDDEFVVTRSSNRLNKTLGDPQVIDHRNDQTRSNQAARGKTSDDLGVTGHRGNQDEHSQDIRRNTDDSSNRRRKTKIIDAQADCRGNQEYCNAPQVSRGTSFS